MSVLLQQIEDELGKGSVIHSDGVAERAVSYWNSAPMTALAIVRPATTAQVSFVLALCNERGQAVVTHGGRTGCVEGTRSGPDDIVLSLERMNAVSDVDAVSATVTVEAGAILEKVQETVARDGLLLPLDLGARGSCTIGGNLATNAGGINVIRYGMARALTVGLEAVLPDGTVVSSMDKMLKNNAGFDLKQLFIGTEGALGVITRAILRLRPLPITKNTAMAAVKDFDSVIALLRYLQARLGGNLSAYEMMEGDYFAAVTELGWHPAPLERTSPYYVIWECDGSDAVRDDDHFQEVLEEAFEQGLIEDAVLPKSEAERGKLWAIRDDFEAILHKQTVYLYDVSLDIGSIEGYVRQVKSQAAATLPGSVVYTIGHIGDSNLHFFIQVPAGVDDSRSVADRAVYEPLREYKGSVSAEHGIGFEKKVWLEQSRSPEEVQLMKLLKNSIDPKHTINRGVVID